MRRHRLANVLLVMALVVLCPAPRARAMRGLVVGQAPPPFVLSDTSGQVFDSASLAGKPAAIVFWSTWSPRSAEALEDFKRLHAELGPKGLAVVAVNVDGENLSAGRQAEIREYVRKLDPPFPVLLDEDLRTFNEFGVIAHPTTVLVDTRGTAVYVLPGYPLSLREELGNELRRVLGIAPPPPPPPASAAVAAAPAGHALQHYNLGRRLLSLGQHDKALERLDKAAELDPSFLDAAILAARIRTVTGDAAKAETLLTTLEQGGVERADARFLRGFLFLTRGDVAAAEGVFAALADSSPREAWGWWGRGMAALAGGDPAAAADLLEKARGIDPENLEAEWWLASWLKARWLRRETVPEEDRLVALFPSLGESRDRYRRLFGAAP